MNSLRTPIILLVIVIIALGAWYVLAHQNFTATLPQTSSPTTTAAQTSASSASAPAQDEPTVAAGIVGTWQSNDDADYSVIVTSSGKWTDLYKGGASSSASETGTYELFTSKNPDADFTGVLVPGAVYVKVSEGTSVYYFNVLDASGNALQLNYLDRGLTLSFTREQ